MPGGYKVVSANGISLAWIYSVDDGVQRAASPNSLRHVEALALAKAIVGLGEQSCGDAQLPLRPIKFDRYLDGQG
jgi:hypothetical protein